MGASWGCGAKDRFRFLLSGVGSLTERSGDTGFRVVLELPDDPRHLKDGLKNLKKQIVGRWKNDEYSVAVRFSADEKWEKRMYVNQGDDITDESDGVTLGRGEYRVQNDALSWRIRISNSSINPYAG